MKTLTEAIHAMDAGLFTTFGTSLTITPKTGSPYTATGIIDHGVERLGEYGEVKGTVSTISFMRHAVPDIKTGDRIALGNASWTIDRLESDDGFIVKYALEPL